MRSLYESILDDEELIDSDDAIIKYFIKKNYRNIIKYTNRRTPRGNIIDVDSNVYMENSDESSLTGNLFTFGNVKGSFNIYHCNNIKNLQGSPKIVNKGVSIINCDNLETLKGGPEKVKGGFFLSGCDKITSLEGAPKEIGFDFNCGDCKNIKSIKGLPKKIGRFIYLNFDNLSYNDEQKIKGLNNEKLI